MKAPQKVRLKPCQPCRGDGDWFVALTAGGVEYIRADVVDEIVKALRDVLEIAERNERGTATARARAALARMGEGND